MRVKRMNFASNSVLGKTPKFMNLGLLLTNKADKLNSFFYPASRPEGLNDSSYRIVYGHGIAEVAEGRVIEAKMNSDYIKISEFETMNIFDQENISLTRPIH